MPNHAKVATPSTVCRAGKKATSAPPAPGSSYKEKLAARHQQLQQVSTEDDDWLQLSSSSSSDESDATGGSDDGWWLSERIERSDAEPDSDDERAFVAVLVERKRKRDMLAWARATGKKLNF